MRASSKILWILFATLTSLLVLVLSLTPPRRSCVLTGRPAAHAKILRLGGRCYELHTCSPDCHQHLEVMASRYPEDFEGRYCVRRHGPASLALTHPDTSRHQVVKEVSCAGIGPAFAP
jgi:hypothetical protein